MVDKTAMKFVDMGFGGKSVFIVKLVLFFLSFGFAFPTLLTK